MADSKQFRRSRWRPIVWRVVTPLVLVFGVSVTLINVEEHTGPYHVGSCFRMGKAAGVWPPVGGLREVGGRAIPVSCTTPHDAKITRAVRNSSACVEEGAWLTSGVLIYCVALVNPAGSS